MGYGRGLVEFAARALIVVLLLRTFLVEVCAVPTGSMAPAILGLHLHLTCADCGLGFDCEAASFTPGERAICLSCGGIGKDSAAAPAIAGDRVLVDKTAFRLRAPRRWEPIVFRGPEVASTLFVKRVVGLPGESIQIVSGNVHINGQIARKMMVQQRAMAILVHDAGHSPKLETGLPPRWQSMEEDGAWRSANGRFRCDPTTDHRPPATDDRPPATDHRPPTTLPPDHSWLIYNHWCRGLNGIALDCITDQCGYDQSTPRVDEDISPVVDLMLSCRIRSWGNGVVALWATNGVDKFLVNFKPQAGQIELLHNGNRIRSGSTSGPIFARPSRLELSLFDRQVLVAVDGDLVLDPYPFDFAEWESQPTFHPFAIGAREIAIEVSQLRIYRDVYYTRPLGLRRTWGIERPYRLPGDDFFVLGDNSPVSEDSRLWESGPGVNRKLLVGKPFAAQSNRPLMSWAGGRFQVPALEQIRYIR